MKVATDTQTDDLLPKLEGRIASDEARIEELEADIRLRRGRIRVDRDVRAIIMTERRLGRG